MATEDRFFVRVASEADGVEIVRLIEAAYMTLLHGHYDMQQIVAAVPSTAEIAAKLSTPGRCFVAAEEHGALVGTGAWTERGDSAYLQSFATHPDWIGRGVARAIYEACEHEVRACGITLIQCHSTLSAESFYAALGFRRVRQEQVRIADKVTSPVVFMTRSIDPATPECTHELARERSDVGQRGE